MGGSKGFFLRVGALAQACKARLTFVFVAALGLPSSHASCNRMGFLRRFFCLSSHDWSSEQCYSAGYVSARNSNGWPAGALPASHPPPLPASRPLSRRPPLPPPPLPPTPQDAGGFQALRIIEQDLNARLSGADSALPNVRSVAPPQQMYGAGLPPAAAQLCQELLLKIAALDKARKAVAEVRFFSAAPLQHSSGPRRLCLNGHPTRCCGAARSRRMSSWRRRSLRQRRCGGGAACCLQAAALASAGACTALQRSELASLR